MCTPVGPREPTGRVRACERFATACARADEYPHTNLRHCGHRARACAGDSITVAPAQTLTDKEYQRLRDAAIAIIREMGVECGGSNVQVGREGLQRVYGRGAGG